MKKLFLLVFFLITSIHAHHYKNSSHATTSGHKNGGSSNVLKKNKTTTSQESLAQSMQHFVQLGDAASLDALLGKLDSKTKKSILAKQFSVRTTKGGSLSIDILSLAVCYEYCEVATVLIKHGINCNVHAQCDGFTPLTNAIIKNLPKMAELLITSGANVNFATKDGFTPLAIAVDNTDAYMVEMLLRHGADSNLSCADGFNTLTRAVERNLQSMVELLIKQNVPINTNDANGSTALYIAAQKGFVDLVSVLVKNGADINMVNQYGLTPLAMAVDKNNIAMVETLVAHGADINRAGTDGFSPLNRAVADNLQQMVSTLIRLGADVNYLDTNGNVALYLAAQKGFAQLVPLLVNGGADINMPIRKGFTPLSVAIDINCIAMVATLVAHGADINRFGNDGYSPLNRAISNNLKQMVSTLIRLGADINRVDANGNYPLLLAIEKGYQDIIEDLIAHNADVNVQDGDGNTPLHKAIEKSYDNLIDKLIEHGADVTIKNDNNVRPSLLAEMYGKQTLAKVLFNKQEPSLSDLIKALDENNVDAFFSLLKYCKSNPVQDHQSNVGLTLEALIVGNRDVLDLCFGNNKDFVTRRISGHEAIHYAVMYGHDVLTRYLVEERHVDVNTTDFYGLTPLHYAVIYRNYDMVEYLIKKKCCINQQSHKDLGAYKNGSTPYDLAVQLGYTEIINLLSSYRAKGKKAYTANNALDQMGKLALFIDINNECAQTRQQLVSVKSALSKELRSLIRQKACPIVMIGQHMLRNVVHLSGSFKDWLIIEIEWNKVGGYLLIPKRLIVNVSSDMGSVESLLEKLGFSIWSISHTCVDEAAIINKKTDPDAIDAKRYSSLIPTMLDALLLPRERVVYWCGHGSSSGTKYIGNVMSDDASKLLDVLARKNTKFVWISTCFLGGKNLDCIGTFPDMTVVSSATTEIILCQTTGLMPSNWGGFFNGLAFYSAQQHNSDEYLAREVFPLLTKWVPHVSNFPHIKHRGSSTFTLLTNDHALLLNPELMACYTSQTEPYAVEKKKMVELVDLEQIMQPILITRRIPLLISNTRKNVFKHVCIGALSNKTNLDFVSVIRKLTRASVFRSSTIENVFVIKELSFSQELLLDAKNNNKHLPKNVYNVVIVRGPSSACRVFLSSDKGALTKTNSMCIAYNNKTSQWVVNTDMSNDEFVLYQQTLS